MNDVDDVFEQYRPLMFSIAYRMVGSASDAEDLVQDAFVRFHRAAERQTIDNPKAYLAQTTTRLGIDHLRSARVRRESYTGTWLPEPLLTEQEPDVADHAEQADSLSMAFLVLLESLSPVERAVFLLHDVFDYPYDEVAELIGKSPDNTRQLAVRARRHVDERKPRFEADRKRRDELAGRFFAAITSGEVEALKQLLARDVVMYGDGGGNARAVARPLNGSDRVAAFLGYIARQVQRASIGLEPAMVNGEPGALARDPDGRVLGVVSLHIADGVIQSIHTVVNPEKLGHLGPVGDMNALLGSLRA